MMLAGALAFGAAHAAEKKYKHESCYNYMRGIEATQNDDDEEAKKYLEAEIKDHPNCDRAYQQLAVIYGNDMEYGDALTYINLAIKHCPKSDKENQAFNHYVKGKVMESLDRPDEAEAEFTESIKLDSENSDRYYKRASFYYRCSDYDKALADFKKASELAPGLANSFVGMGACYEAQEKYQEAYDSYQYASKLSPSDATIMAYKADALLGLNKYADAISSYIDALTADTDCRAASTGLLKLATADASDVLIAKLKAQHIKKPNENMWTKLLAFSYQFKEQYGEALKLYKELNADEPDAGLYTLMAGIYDNVGDFQKAVDYIDKAQELDSIDTELLTKKCDYLIDKGDFDKAIETANAYIDAEPDDPSGYALRSAAYMCKREYEKTVDDITTAINLGADNTNLYYMRGSCLRRLGKAEEAKADFQTVAADSASSSVHACALYYLGKEAEAKAELDSLAKTDSIDSDTYYNMACAYSVMGDKEEALKCLENCLKQQYNTFAILRSDCEFDSIRQLPEFKALVSKYEEEAQKRVSELEKESKTDNAQYEEATCQVPYTKKGGVTQVKCEVNGLPLHFIFDTGASSISISSVEAMFMLKNEYLNEKDIVGTSLFTDANGDISEGTVINLKNVKIGDAVLHDVKASVVHNQKAPLLLGQTAFQKFGKMEIDNEHKVVNITYKKKK